MEQLLIHLVGDYVTQSEWMANNKTKRHWPALCHALVYSLPFLLIGSLKAWSVIFVTHFFIDRYRLARYVIFLKNHILRPQDIGACLHWFEEDWEDCKGTGYPSATPAWLAVWLMIVCDNTMHLAINYAALRWL